MFKIFPILVATISALASEEKPKADEIAKISETMGHLIGKNLERLGLPIDFDALARGMRHASEGEISPLTEEECIQALGALQEESMCKSNEENRKQADAFLKKNETKEGIISLEEGKLQYEIEKQGEGEAIQPYNCPLVRYQGHYLNGPLIPETEQLIDLEGAIPGFSKALIGMKEGEKRTLYIHPELASKEQNSPKPGALLIFEVEILKADASSEANAASSSEQLPLRPHPDLEILE